MADKYRYKIYLDQGQGFVFYKQAYPVNGDDVEYKWEKPDGMIFRRHKLSKELVFGNTDFKWLKKIEESQICQEMHVEVERLCNGIYYYYWSGYFTASSGKWDTDRCTFTVKPEPNDDYRCMFDQGGIDKNVLEITSQISIRVPSASLYETAICYDTGHFATVFANFAGTDAFFMDVFQSTPPQSASGCVTLAPDQGWQQYRTDYDYHRFPANTNTNIDLWDIKSTWMREYIYTTDLLGLPNPPAGTGWVQDLFTVGVPVGKHRWVRKPYGGIYTTYTQTQFNGPLPLSFSNPSNGNYFMRNTWILNLPGNYVEYTRARRFSDVLDFLLPCSGLTIKSDFLRINSLLSNTDPDYVTGLPSKLRNIAIETTTDAVLPTATEPTTKGLYNWLDCMEDLWKMFDIYWDIKDGVVRIEHEKFFVKNNGLDLTQGKFAESLKMSSRYSYDLKDLPKYESWEFAHADSDDFVGTPIWYDSICVSQDSKNNKTSYRIQRVTTDIGMIQRAPDDFGRTEDGWVYLCCDETLGVFTLDQSVGKISGVVQLNGHFSAANLQDAYQRYGRILSRGYLNNVLTDFEDWLRTKRQDTLVIPLCCSDKFNPDELMKTGEGWGEIQEATYSTKNDTLQIILKHY